MTGRDGSTVLDEAADPDLRRALDLIGTLADGPAPPPSAALAEMLERGVEPVDPVVVPFRRPAPAARRWATRTGAGLAVAAASVLVAGSAAALPPALQDTVADVVGALTPFELPRPPAEPGRAAPAGDEDDAGPAGAPSATPTRTVPPTPSSEPPLALTDAPTRSADDSPESGPDDDSDDPQRVERDRQRAAEEAAEESAEAAERSQRAADEAAEEAAEESQRAAEDAADEAEDAARDAAREQEDAAEDAADEAEDAADD